MSARRRSDSTATLIGAGIAGAAGLAVVLGLAPTAGAAPASTDAPQAQAPEKVQPKVAPESGSETSSSGDVVPNYGAQKYRVGVKVKDGSYVPEGTTTAGTELHVVVTGPPQDEDRAAAPGDVVIDEFDCTTVDSTPDDPTDATFCPGITPTVMRAQARKAGYRPSAVVVPTPGDAKTGVYPLAAGQTATVTQKTVNKNLVIDGGSAVVGPCEVTLSGPPYCTSGEGESLDIKKSDAVMEDTGLPPTAKDDSATTKVDTTVSIPLSDNDTPNAPVKDFEPVTKPKHGKVGFGLTDDGADGIGSYAAQYTPAEGFVGTDEFTYSITTANGTATATVTVTVTAPPPVAKNDTATTEQGKPVTIDVLKNDTTAAGTLSLAGATGPEHGSLDIKGNSIVYTPDKDFLGKDTFVYTAKTAYGEDLATVTVTVTGLGIDDNVKRRDELADTGAQSSELIGYGAALLIGGGLAVGAGTRRRRRARHAAR